MVLITTEETKSIMQEKFLKVKCECLGSGRIPYRLYKKKYAPPHPAVSV